MTKRNVEIFVDEMVEKGRTLKQVLAVSDQTHWKTQKEEIKKYFNNGR